MRASLLLVLALSLAPALSEAQVRYVRNQSAGDTVEGPLRWTSANPASNVCSNAPVHVDLAAGAANDEAAMCLSAAGTELVRLRRDGVLLLSASAGFSCSSCVDLGSDTAGPYLASLSCGAGLTGCVAASEGAAPTLALTTTVVAGSCVSCDLTYDAQGRITAAASGGGGGITGGGTLGRFSGWSGATAIGDLPAYVDNFAAPLRITLARQTSISSGPVSGLLLITDSPASSYISIGHLTGGGVESIKGYVGFSNPNSAMFLQGTAGVPTWRFDAPTGTEVFRFDTFLRLLPTMVLVAGDCDAADEVGRVAMHAVSDTKSLCACEQTGAGTYAWRALSATGVCP